MDMTFKIQKLAYNIHLVRAYCKGEDINFSFVCTLYKQGNEKQWQILGALSTGLGIKATKEILRYLKDYPDGAYTYVSKKDFERFYKRFCEKIDFDDCNF